MTTKKKSKALLAAIALELKRLSPERLAVLQDAARAEWEYVAYDMLQIVAEMEERPLEKVSVPRDEVIETVLDAGRIEQRLKQAGHVDLVQWLDSTTYEVKIAAVRPAFPYARYGS